MLLLSIIIPVYNVELYVEKCILSCINQQSSSSFEIIVVNDGSTDGSAEILELISKKYHSIKIINQSNQGLSVARNVGLQNANGEYVWFVDSDDWIEPNSLSRICSRLKDNLDILQLQYRYVYADESLNHEAQFTHIEGIKSGRNIILDGGLPAPAQFCIYRRKFLLDNNLFFKPGIYHEDSEFKPRATFLAHRIASDLSVSYNYLQRSSGSITSKFRLKNGLDIICVINSLLDFASATNMDDCCKRYFYNHIGMDVNTLLYGYGELSSFDKNKLYSELLKQKRIYRAMMSCSNIKYKIEGVLLFFNLKFAMYLYKLFSN